MSTYEKLISPFLKPGYPFFFNTVRLRWRGLGRKFSGNRQGDGFNGFLCSITTPAADYPLAGSHFRLDWTGIAPAPSLEYRQGNRGAGEKRQCRV